MSVVLISFTTSTNSDLKTASDIIVYVARVSNPSSQMRGLNSDKLISYLIKHSHWSPFEMVDLCVEIKTTLDVATQILRHRSFSFQQFSMRYADIETAYEDTETTRELRMQHPTNRQSSLESTNTVLCEEWNKKQDDIYNLCRESYDWAINNGVAKEVARCVLPQATNTRLYMKGSVRSFIHYIQVRSRPDTQKEHRQVALAMADVIENVFPQIRLFVHSDEEEVLNSIETTLMS